MNVFDNSLSAPRVLQTLFMFAIGVAVAIFGAFSYNTWTLDRTVRTIDRSFPATPMISTAELAALSRDQSVIILDIRTKPEYAISHIEGALHIDPDGDTGDVLNVIDSDVKGKTLVFYCSVGFRSSQFLSKTKDDLRKAGVDRLYNLRGGIFTWRNQERPLGQGATSTTFVHPRNWYWARLLEDDSAIQYKPIY